MRFLILGQGYIGKYLSDRLMNNSTIGVRIDSQDKLSFVLNNFDNSYIVVNCIGKTGKPNVDWCEDNRAETVFSNIDIPVMLAEECKRRGMYWIHIGSGCIYNGYDKEFTEEDAPNFNKSFYSKTKLISQWMLEQDYRNLAILRIRMPIDEEINDRSYIAKVVKYAKAGYPIFDMQNSMTTLDDLVKVIHFMGERRSIGTFNVVNHGSMSPTDVLEVWKELKEPDLKWNKATYDQVRKTIKADRSNCVLSPKKLARAGYWMPDIKEKIREFLS